MPCQGDSVRQRTPRIRLRLTVPFGTLLPGRPNQTQSSSRIGVPLSNGSIKWIISQSAEIRRPKGWRESPLPLGSSLFLVTAIDALDGLSVMWRPRSGRHFDKQTSEIARPKHV